MTPASAPLRTETLTFGVDHHAREVPVLRPPTYADCGFETVEAFQAWAADAGAAHIAPCVARLNRG